MIWATIDWDRFIYVVVFWMSHLAWMSMLIAWRLGRIADALERKK